MSFTVRVIFWGLTAFVPNEEGQRGLTALLVRPAAEPHSCAEHVAVAYLYQGTCEPIDKCEDVPDEYREDVAETLETTKPPLRWLLQYEDLEIFGEEKKVTLKKGGRKTLFGNEREAPNNERQTADFRWVPSMDVLTGGHGRVRDDCLYWVGTCPLNARFKVRGGQARTCHLFHKEKDPQNEDQKVVIFEYKTADGKTAKVRPRAVADAMKVEFEVEGEYLELRAWNFPTASEQQSIKRTVKLKPTDGRVTLIVSNGPRHMPSEEKCGEHPHQDSLYDLLAREPVTRLFQEELRTEEGSPGTCETEITALAYATFDRAAHAQFDKFDKKGRREVPHSPTACDGASYP